MGVPLFHRGFGCQGRFDRLRCRTHRSNLDREKSLVMQIEVMLVTAVLERWKRGPHEQKRRYSFFADWQSDDVANDLPPSRREIEGMKKWLERHAPTSYRRLFRGAS